MAKFYEINKRMLVKKNWKSTWFADKYDYTSLLIEDIHIRSNISQFISNTKLQMQDILIFRNQNYISIQILYNLNYKRFFFKFQKLIYKQQDLKRRILKRYIRKYKKIKLIFSTLKKKFIKNKLIYLKIKLKYKLKKLWRRILRRTIRKCLTKNKSYIKKKDRRRFRYQKYNKYNKYNKHKKYNKNKKYKSYHKYNKYNNTK